MPSASAKIEKITSSEAADPVKQFTITLEKKVRNLEKRKQKLDNYRSDVENGKELNEDQKIAVSKYDCVVELLEYSKELNKSLSGIIQECSRIQKKLAKKEQIERQQHEIQRLQEALCYKHILSCLANEDVRNDLSNGENGAPKLSAEDLACLDHFYKLVEPNLPNDQADIQSHFHSLAENFIFLVEGKNKEVVGTTYKAVKELLYALKESGYFTKSTEIIEDDSAEEILPEPEETLVIESNNLSLAEDPVIIENGDSNYDHGEEPEETDVITEEVELEIVEPNEDYEEPEQPVALIEAPPYANQNGSLQEVLASQSSFNFLQESQIELDTPHMDPAVVAVHHVTPPSALNFNQQYQQITSPEQDSSIVAQQDIQQYSVQAEQQQAQESAQRGIQPVLSSSIQQSDFDPNHPIPTQTYTNQSYAVMQHVIMPPYVPVTMHHGPLPPHIAPIAVTLSPAASTQTSTVVPMHVTVAPAVVASSAMTDSVIITEDTLQDEICESVNEHSGMNGNLSGPESCAQHNGDKTDDSEGFMMQNNHQRGYRGRGRGRGQVGGYYRGRGGYNRGGYQNNYYQGNFRRGAPRGRSNGNIRGNNRGGGFNRPQQNQDHQ